MDVMLDLETFGVRPGCVVASIGAVAFDPVAQTLQPDCFYETLYIQPQLDAGLFVQADTLKFWMTQEVGDAQAARRALFENQKEPSHVLESFSRWYIRHQADKIWGHGESFDIPILEALYAAFKINTPWHYRSGRDTRTLFDVVGKKMGDFGTKSAGAHNALMDALFQTKEILACFKLISDIKNDAEKYDTL